MSQPANTIPNEKEAKRNQTLRLTVMAMLAAISLVLVFLIRFPLFPSYAFLEYDMADVPILLGAFMLGPWSGMLILVVVSLIQAFMLGGNGIIGFIMHVVASGALIVTSSLVSRVLKEKAWGRVLGLLLGTVAMAAVMIPMNLFFTPILTGAPREFVATLILPVLLPFNFLKAGLNSVIFFIIYMALTPVIKNYRAKL